MFNVFKLIIDFGIDVWKKKRNDNTQNMEKLASLMKNS